MSVQRRKRESRPRDEFNEQTRREVALRVGNRCSKCNSLTCGPQLDSTKSLNIGVAAHITAAAPNDPRFDEKLSSKERKHSDNAIWLCQNCGKLVDNDAARFTVEELRRWKQEAEERTFAALGVSTAIIELTIKPPPAIPLDKLSLSAYLGSNQRVRQLDERMAKDAGVALYTKQSMWLSLLERAQFFKFENIAQLDEALEESSELIIRLGHYFKPQSQVVSGHCLSIMFELMAARLGSVEAFVEYQDSLQYSHSDRGWAKDVIEAYEQIMLYS